MDDPLDFVIGAGAIGLGIAAQGIPGVGTFVGAALFSFGAGRLASGVGLFEGQQGIEEGASATTARLPIVYGRAVVGEALADLMADPATAGDDQVSGKIVAFAVGSENGAGIHDIITIDIDGELAIAPVGFREKTELGGSSATVSNVYENNLEYTLYPGTDTQEVPAWIVERFDDPEFSVNWDERFRGRGIAHLDVRLIFDKEVFPSVPKFQFKVEGNRVYDPRDPTGGPDSDGFAFTNNPWLCLLDYLTSKRYGLAAAYSERDGGDTSEIDEQSFIDSANHADELVPYTQADGTVGSQKRHTFDGWLKTASQPEHHKQNIGQLVQSTGGMLVHQNGKWRAVPKRPTAAVDYTLDESNIIGQWSGSRSGISDAPNRIRADYIDADREYVAQSVHWPETNAENVYRDEDSDYPSILSLDLPGVTDRARAQRMAQVALKEARADRTYQLRADESALQLQVGDVVPLKHPTPGYTDAKGFPDGKKFWIHAQQIFFEDESLQVGLTLREYDPDAYVTELGDPPDEPGDPILPDPRPGPIDTALIGAWLLGFGGCHQRNCDPEQPCEPCLQCVDDPRRRQSDFSGNGNFGAILKSAGFGWNDACPASGVVGVSYSTTGGHKVRIQGSASSEILQLSNPEGGDGFSAMGWFYSTSAVNTTASFGQQGDQDTEGWSASINGSGTTCGFGYYDQDGNPHGPGLDQSGIDIEAAIGRSVGQDEWVHYAVVVHPCDANGDFIVDAYVNGRWIGNWNMTDGPIAAATNTDFGWGDQSGDGPNSVDIVGKMNQGLIYDGALSRQDVSSIQSGETANPTPTPSVTTIDDLGDGQEYARVRQEWTDDGRPLDWIDDLTISIQGNDDCAGGGGLSARLSVDFSTLTSDEEGDWRVFVDWWEDDAHVKQETTTNIWDIAGGTSRYNYTDATTGSDAGDATEHHIVARLILMDITGSDPVAVDAKHAAIRATYGTC